MPVPDFLDTNVLVYAYDASDKRKQGIARELVRRAVAGEMVVSTQVLGEFCATLLHKLSPSPQHKQVATILEALSPIKVVSTDGDMVRRAVDVNGTYKLHFYDGMIVAAAERAGSTTIWSEDLNPGQEYFGIRVQDPFA
ncbi:MAG: PIN domain-containing protein [Terriglobales bacterium]|jgi:predicted nucleic acid-binding protein